jgi:hypothetical protein
MSDRRGEVCLLDPLGAQHQQVGCEKQAQP